ncbi:MAG: hypothetical protein ACLQU1_11115 [Bryobacteraceae bacterium]
MEYDFDPKHQSDLKLVGPDAGKEFQAARARRRAAEAAAQQPQNPAAPTAPDPEPALTE